MHIYELCLLNNKTACAEGILEGNQLHTDFFGTNFTQTFFMFNSSCKFFLTVSLLAFTFSEIIQTLIRRSPCTTSMILVTVCRVET